MMKYINRALILLSLCISSSLAHTSDLEINLTWDKSGALQAEEHVFIESFYNAYKDLTKEQLPVEDKYLFIKGAFDEEVEEFKSNPEGVHWVSAKTTDGVVVGYASFEYHAQSQEVYIRQMGVKPEYQKHGIGKQIIKAGISKYPNADKAVMITRKINDGAFKFYKKIGFTECQYMHEGYNPDLYAGLELTLKS